MTCNRSQTPRFMYNIVVELYMLFFFKILITALRDIRLNITVNPLTKLEDTPEITINYYIHQNEKV